VPPDDLEFAQIKHGQTAKAVLSHATLEFAQKDHGQAAEAALGHATQVLIFFWFWGAGI
jgi:hypothetical protein